MAPPPAEPAWQQGGGGGPSPRMMMTMMMSDSDSRAGLSHALAQLPKPKRPMTAYNFFVRAERKLVISMGVPAYETMMMTRDIAATAATNGTGTCSAKGSGNGAGHGKEEGARPAASAGGATSGALSTAWNSARASASPSTAHAVTGSSSDGPAVESGKISKTNNGNDNAKSSPKTSAGTSPAPNRPAAIPFELMGKIIGRSWKRVPPDDLKRYQALAIADMERYEREKNIYAAKVESVRAAWARRYAEQDQQGAAGAHAVTERSSFCDSDSKALGGIIKCLTREQINLLLQIPNNSRSAQCATSLAPVVRPSTVTTTAAMMAADSARQESTASITSNSASDTSNTKSDEKFGSLLPLFLAQSQQISQLQAQVGMMSSQQQQQSDRQEGTLETHPRQEQASLPKQQLLPFSPMPQSLPQYPSQRATTSPDQVQLMLQQQALGVLYQQSQLPPVMGAQPPQPEINFPNASLMIPTDPSALLASQGMPMAQAMNPALMNRFPLPANMVGVDVSSNSGFNTNSNGNDSDSSTSILAALADPSALLASQGMPMGQTSQGVNPAVPMMMFPPTASMTNDSAPSHPGQMFNGNNS